MFSWTMYPKAHSSFVVWWMVMGVVRLFSTPGSRSWLSKQQSKDSFKNFSCLSIAYIQYEWRRKTWSKLEWRSLKDPWKNKDLRTSLQKIISFLVDVCIFFSSKQNETFMEKCDENTFWSTLSNCIIFIFKVIQMT